MAVKYNRRHLCACGCGGTTRGEYLFGHKTITERISRKLTVDPITGCWIHSVSPGNDGYARIHLKDGCAPIHRIVFQSCNGPIPDGMEIDHLCRNRACVRPDHLQLVTHRENVRRGVSRIAKQMARSRCLRGHEFSKVTSRGRVCMECARLRHHLRKARRLEVQ